ncbi:type VI secretion system baseplate subunit TssF [Pedobacter sp. L105]|uniref:type VI secretion system baseplate subunit TssF n=1 Tax=Pedobacter sp. L105 TaxID=1641871 RepID=UPI00131E86CB|nr:type VI secretion system baseplate subunit TssF [Pedobacter sp. L105]
MKNIFYSSKDEIRNRILKNARDYWGIKNTNDFDPLVKLLIEALSTELFNVSNDVKNLENRVLDKISRILASDTLTSALPAHAIAHARPHEPSEIIDTKTQFYFRKKLKDMNENSTENSADIFFSPLKPIKVFNAEVVYLASGSNLFQVDSQHHKSLLTHTNRGSALEPNTLYIGIRPPSTLKILNGISFYFDWRNYAINNNIYDLLALSKWSVNGLPVNTALDKFYITPALNSNSPFDNHDILNLLTEDVHSFYANRFLTIDDDHLNPQHFSLQLYPKEFEQLFQPGSLVNLKKELLWLKVVFPAAITEVMLDELHISINAFPVVNKRIHDFKHRLKMMTNIIPVKVQDHDQFLSVHSLGDKMGNIYTEIPHSHDDDSSAGSFSIRYGGSERFDNRNAKEVVDYLFELLRDEKASFSAYGSDFLNSSLKELEQNISIIQQKTKAQLATMKELLNYIIVKPLNNADIMFLEFWTTNAEMGNQIRSGSRLQSFENSKMIPDSIFLLSNTQGGRSRLNAANRVQAFKYGLTTANRIVTQSDVINFCSYELGNKIKGLKLAKGLMVAQNPKEGFIKTTDIIITPANQHDLNKDEWKSILELTQSKLENRSIMNIHYRLLLA